MAGSSPATTLNRRQDPPRCGQQDGQCDIRKLLIVGAMSVIRWVVRRGGSANRWLASLVARKPRMVAAVALANKMARMVWAMSTKGEDYRMA